MITKWKQVMIITVGSAESFSEEQKDWSTIKDARLYAESTDDHSPDQDVFQVEKRAGH
jgi:hypothetical protein